MTGNDPTAVSFNDGVVAGADLRSIYRDPSQLVLEKAIDHVDEGVRGFIERSPMVILATGDGSRNDSSPRGGPPGFVKVLDQHRLAFGDLVGNNRLDSYRNLMDHPGIGLLFMIPGLLETLRVNGRALLSTAVELREACAIEGRIPRVVIGIDVEECFIHCGAALRRAAMWDTDTWPSPADRPSPGAMLKAHMNLDVSADSIEANLNEYYTHGAWSVGGDA